MVYTTFAITSRLNIGHRHLLPLYVCLFVLLGAVGRRLWRRSRPAGRVVAACLVAWHVGAALGTHPHYLAYFNALVGGPVNGRYFLVDSSLDWGQDLPELATVLSSLREAERSPDLKRLYHALFTAARPEAYGIEGEDLLRYGGGGQTCEVPVLRPGFYAISASIMMGPYIRAPHPWDHAAEVRLQQTRSRVRAAVREAQGSRERLLQYLLATPEEEGAGVLAEYQHLRLRKLCLSFERKEPLATPGHSNLVYRATQSDLRDAGLDDGVGFPAGFRLHEVLCRYAAGNRDPAARTPDQPGSD